MKKILAISLTVVLILTLVPSSGLAAVFGGIDGHWAEESLAACDEMGLLDGLAKPSYSIDDKATRGDMFKIMNNIMKYPDAEGLTFTDLDETHPYYETLTNMSAAGIVTGYPDGSVKPDDTVTREEAMVIFARVFNVAPNESAAYQFSDGSSVGSWARPLIGGMEALGYIQGYEDKSFRPATNISYAELVKMIDNMLASVISEAGTYTDDSGAGYTIVNTSGVTLKDMTVEGDLIAAAGIGKGDLTLDGVKIGGRLIVNGGGVNSIVITGESDIGEIIVSVVNGEVSISVQGGANVNVVYIDDGSDDVFINGSISSLVIGEGSDVTLNSGAKVGSITMEGNDAAFTILSGASAGTLDIQGDGSNVVVNGTLENGAVSSSNTSISGSGKITGKVAYTGGSDNEISVPGAKVVVEEGAGDVKAGSSTVTAGKEGSVPGGTTTGPIGPIGPSYNITGTAANATGLKLTSGINFEPYGSCLDVNSAKWDALTGPTASFKVGYSISGLTSTTHVALAFKVEAEVGDTTSAQLLALDKAGDDDPWDTTIWNVLGNRTYPAKEGAGDFADALVDKGYGGYWGRVNGREVTYSYTKAVDDFKFYVPDAGTYTLTIDLIDFDGIKIDVLTTKKITIMVETEVITAGKYYKIKDSSGTAAYLTAAGTRTANIGEIGAITTTGTVVVHAEETLVEATGYDSTAHGTISVTEHNPVVSITDAGSNTLNLPNLGGESQYEINLINFLGKGSTDNTPNKRVGELGNSNFQFAVIGRDDGTGPFYILYDEDPELGWTNAKLSNGGTPDLADTVIYKIEGYQSVGEQYPGYVFYLPPNEEVNRTYIFDCDNGEFVFLKVCVTLPK